MSVLHITIENFHTYIFDDTTPLEDKGYSSQRIEERLSDVSNDITTDADNTYLRKSSNLSDVASASTARTNLGLGALATLGSVGTSQIDDDAVSYSKIQNVSAASKLLGRGDSGSGDVQELTIGSGLVMTGTTLSSTGGGSYTDEQAQDAVGAMVDSTLVYTDATPLLSRAALTGDVTASAGSNVLTIADDAVTSSKIDTAAVTGSKIMDGAVTYEKIQEVSTTSRLLGHGTSTGDSLVEEIILGTNLSMSGNTLNASGSGYSDEQAQDAVGTIFDSTLVYNDATPSIGRAALTGDVTASAGSNATTIANDAVTFSKMLNSTAASVIVGRGSASGAGDFQELTVSTGLQISGTVLSSTITQYSDELAQDAVGAMVDSTLVYTDATPLLSRAALTGDVTASAGSNTTTIANNAVTSAKIANSAVTPAKISNAGASSGQVLTYDGANTLWADPTGGSSAIDIEDDGAPAGTFDTLNFTSGTGISVTVTNVSGTAEINIESTVANETRIIYASNLITGDSTLSFDTDLYDEMVNFLGQNSGTHTVSLPTASFAYSGKRITSHIKINGGSLTYGGEAGMTGTFTIEHLCGCESTSGSSCSYVWTKVTDTRTTGSYTDEQAQDAVGAMVDSTLVYTDATPLLSRAALTGDVTASAGSNATTIANDAVTTAKIINDAVTFDKLQNATANSKLLGSGDSGSGANYAELTLGTNLSMSGTTLNAASSLDIAGLTALTAVDPHADYAAVYDDSATANRKVLLEHLVKDVVYALSSSSIDCVNGFTQTRSLSADMSSVTISNHIAGRTLTLILTASSADRTLTIPTGHIAPRATLLIPSGKTVTLTVYYDGTSYHWDWGAFRAAV